MVMEISRSPEVEYKNGTCGSRLECLRKSRNTRCEVTFTPTDGFRCELPVIEWVDAAQRHSYPAA
jgi:hypothetical protein